LKVVHRGGEGTALRAEVGIPSVTSHQRRRTSILDLRPTRPRFEIPTFWGSFSTPFFEERVDVKRRRSLSQISLGTHDPSDRLPPRDPFRTLQNDGIAATENPFYVFSTF
jgi:hypothetical protein